MTATEIKKHVEDKINADRVGGWAIDELWHGIDIELRGGVAIALVELIKEEKVEITSKRQFDNVGNTDTITSYRKVWA